MNINEFDFLLPQDLIAQHPPKIRGESRLLVGTPDRDMQDLFFSDCISFFREGDVLVVNNTKVMKARLFGHKETGAKIEILIERVIDTHHAMAHVRASKSPKKNTVLILENNIRAVCEGRDGDLFLLRFDDDYDVYTLMEQNGYLPLPPYITRTAECDDDERYQTIYAQEIGAVAAPTAGLHFTDEILTQLKNQGVIITDLTLHVGAGTFQPVRVENIADHHMHSEWFEISEETVEIIQHAKQNGNRICAVGTTSLRALESAALSGSLKATRQETDIFITPGFSFHVVDMLLTNFHLPKSTLLMLVSAFAGTEYIRELYQHAIEKQYRFFSYGDAMLLYRAKN